MNEYTRFSLMMADAAMHNALPKMLFTENADMRGSVYRLGALTAVDDMVQPSKVRAAVEAYGAAAADLVNNGSQTEVFRRLADTFAEKIQGGIDDLHTVQSTVNSLVARMQTLMDEKMSGDAVLASLYHKNIPLSMEAIAWKRFDVIDEQSLRANIHADLGRGIHEDITRAKISQAINRIPCTTQYNKIELSPIKLTNEKFNSIVASVHKKLPGMSDRHIGGILRNVLDLNENHLRLCAKTADDLATGKAIEKMNSTLSLAVDYVEVLDALDEKTLGLAASTMAEYDKHSAAMQKVSETLLYIASFYRNEIWKDSVLLPGGYLNMDTMDAFTKAGGDVNMVVRHKNQFFSEGHIPVKGVTGDQILKSAKTVSDTIAQESLKNANAIEAKKRQMERDSFVYVATEWLNAHRKDMSATFTGRSDVTKYADSVYHAGLNSPVEMRFYKVILNSCHIGDMVSTLYDRLSSAYTSYTADMGSITETAKQELEYKVYADLISEYLIDSGLIVM